MEREALRIKEAAEVLGLGRSAAYSAVKSGQIPTVRIGGLKLVPRDALRRMLDEAGKNMEVTR